MAKPTLIYFVTRGRAELIRLICAEAGIEYDEHPVDKGTPPIHGRPTDFGALKESGLLPFEAVPVWEEPDGFRLAQSLAIARYLAAQHGLLGKTLRETALCDQMLGAFDDVRAEARKLAIVPPAQHASVRAELDNVILPRWMGFFDRLLAQNHDGTGFVVGDSLTIADLALWYVIELFTDNGFQGIKKFPRLLAYFERIGARPRLAAYVKSPARPPILLLPT